MLQEEHSAILLTFIKLPFVIKIFVLFFIEWLLKTGFTVLTNYMFFLFCGVGRGLMLWLFVGPTGVYLLDFFCSGIQFNLLLSPYPCFISLLYLDLYVLGDDALIS